MKQYSLRSLCPVQRSLPRRFEPRQFGGQHDAAIVCLTEKAADAASLGSLVSLRVEALRQRADDGFRCTVRALKDKRRGPGWSGSEVLRGPAGLR